MKNEIESWDGKSKSDIQSIYDQYFEKEGFVIELIDMLAIPELEKGASWLLKAFIDNGGSFSEAESLKVLGHLKALSAWETKLHFLQILHAIKILNRFKQDIENFLRPLITSENKFVRAWAYNGFYLLAKAYPEYQKEASQFFEMAMRDEAASVKARIRNIMKSGF